MLRRVVLIAISFALLSRAPASASTADAALKASLQRVLQTYLTAHTQDEHISADALSISFPHDPTNLEVAAGTTTWHGNRPATPADLWQIGSNTKAFTAVLLLQLEAEGKLTIDQTVGDWLPQYPAWKNVTIRRLLDMTSGIPGYDNVPAMGRAYASIRRRFTPEMLIAFADPIYGNAPPPTKGWNYSNTNYMLAGLIVERASGESYSRQLRKRIFAPVGLTNTYYSPNVYSKGITDRMVSGYFDNRGPGNEPFAQFLGVDMRTSDLSWAGAAGGIVASLRDLTRWARALYQGNMLAAAQRRELTTIVSTATGKPIKTTTLSDPQGFGLGVGQATHAAMGTYWYYQGETLGNRTVYVYFPKQDVVLAVGVNSQPTKNHIRDLLSGVWKTLRAAHKI